MCIELKCSSLPKMIFPCSMLWLLSFCLSDKDTQLLGLRHCQDSCLWWDSKVHSNTEQMVPFPSHHLLSAQNRMGGVSCWGITSKVLQACFVWAWGSWVLVMPSGGSALTVPTKAQAPAPQMALQGPWGSNTLHIGRIRMDCFLQAGISFTAWRHSTCVLHGFVCENLLLCSHKIHECAEN